MQCNKIPIPLTGSGVKNGVVVKRDYIDAIKKWQKAQPTTQL
jgi:hypothetical protein